MRHTRYMAGRMCIDPRVRGLTVCMLIGVSVVWNGSASGRLHASETGNEETYSGYASVLTDEKTLDDYYSEGDGNTDGETVLRFGLEDVNGDGTKELVVSNDKKETDYNSDLRIFSLQDDGAGLIGSISSAGPQEWIGYSEKGGCLYSYTQSEEGQQGITIYEWPESDEAYDPASGDNNCIAVHTLTVGPDKKGEADWQIDGEKVSEKEYSKLYKEYLAGDLPFFEDELFFGWDGYTLAASMDNTEENRTLTFGAASEPETPAAETAAPETAAAETSAPETAATEAVTPETAAAETTAPETAAPETSAPETAATEAVMPETAAAETAAPETAAPETSAPETAVTEAVMPETPAAETTAPETAAPETTAPETSAPETAAPDTTGVKIKIDQNVYNIVSQQVYIPNRVAGKEERHFLQVLFGKIAEVGIGSMDRFMIHQGDKTGVIWAEWADISGNDDFEFAMMTLSGNSEDGSLTGVLSIYDNYDKYAGEVYSKEVNPYVTPYLVRCGDSPCLGFSDSSGNWTMVTMQNGSIVELDPETPYEYIGPEGAVAPVGGTPETAYLDAQGQYVYMRTELYDTIAGLTGAVPSSVNSANTDKTTLYSAYLDHLVTNEITGFQLHDIDGDGVDELIGLSVGPTFASSEESKVSIVTFSGSAINTLTAYGMGISIGNGYFGMTSHIMGVSLTDTIRSIQDHHYVQLQETCTYAPGGFGNGDDHFQINGQEVSEEEYNAAVNQYPYDYQSGGFWSSEDDAEGTYRIDEMYGILNGTYTPETSAPAAGAVELSAVLGQSFDALAQAVPGLAMVRQEEGEEKWEGSGLSATGLNHDQIVRVRLDQNDQGITAGGVSIGMNGEEAKGALSGNGYTFMRVSDGWDIYSGPEGRYIAYQKDGSGCVSQVYIALDGYLPFGDDSDASQNASDSAPTASETAAGNEADSGSDMTMIVPGDMFADGQERRLKTEYLLPASDKKYLTEDDIAHLSMKGCCYARNEIYARHDRMFNSEELNNYFSQRSWYSPVIAPESFTDEYSRSVFNDYEYQNANFLWQYEDAHGMYWPE